MSKVKSKSSYKNVELIENLNKISDWIYQRKEFDHGILIRIFNQLLSVMSDSITRASSNECVNSWLNLFRDKFKELTAAYDAGDLILTADIMHHEFAESLLKGRELTLESIESTSTIDEMSKNNRAALMTRYGLDFTPIDEGEVTFEIDLALDGSRILYAQENGVLMRFNSSYDPAYEALRWASKYDELENIRTVIVLQGLANGFFLRALEATVRTNVSFIVYEPSMELFSYIIDNYNVADIIMDPRVHLVIPSMPEDALYKEVYSAADSSKVNVIAVVTPGYTQNEKFLDICRQVQTIDDAEEGYRLHLAKDAFMNSLYAFSILDNNYLVSDFLKTLPKKLPVILVAGGPSLLKNVKELTRAKGRALIVAVERAVSILLANNVIPDVIVTIDPTKSSEYVMFDDVKNTFLLCGYGANLESMKPHNGHLIFMHSDVRYNALPGLNGRLLNFGDVGGGVAPAAFIHFLYAQIDNLILVGQDLAFEGGMTHADGKNDDLNRFPLFEVDGIDGGKVKTRWDMERFIRFMERKMKEYPHTTVIDATEGGALIHGTKISKLRDVVDKICAREWDIYGIIDCIPYAQSREEHDETITYMCHRLWELREIKRLAPELSNMCRGLVNECKYGDISDKKAVRRINRFNKIRNTIYDMTVNDWLEEIWVTDRYSIPDAYIVVRNNKEALPVFESALNYYNSIPGFCDTLGWVIKDTFGFTEEEYDVRVKDMNIKSQIF